MRIHANKTSALDIKAAAAVAHADITVLDSKGSRSRTQAFEVKLGGDSPYRPMGGSVNDEYAASWDQWGIFLAALFAMDDSVATTVYPTAEHFHIVTGGRFETLTEHGAEDYETRHKWSPNGDMTQSCERCSATFRWDVPTPKIGRYVPSDAAVALDEMRAMDSQQEVHSMRGQLEEASLW